MRSLLYEAAQVLLTRVSKWSWLKAWAMAVARRRGLRRAIVALARRLAVIMRNASAHEQIWSASMREYLDPDPTKLGGTIQTVTASLFSTYPGRKPAR